MVAVACDARCDSQSEVGVPIFLIRRALAADEQMASMRSGSGDEYSIVFAPVGAYARGFDHESPMSPYAQSPPAVWPGVGDEVPVEFASFVREPAFSDGLVPRVTACLWRHAADVEWRRGAVTLPGSEADPDGADWLFEQLDGQPMTYREYALECWERRSTLPLSATSTVMSHFARGSLAFQSGAFAREAGQRLTRDRLSSQRVDRALQGGL